MLVPVSLLADYQYCTRTKYKDFNNGYTYICTNGYYPIVFRVFWGPGTTPGSYQVKRADGSPIVNFSVPAGGAAGSYTDPSPHNYYSFGTALPDVSGANTGTFNGGIEDDTAVRVDGPTSYPASGGGWLGWTQTNVDISGTSGPSCGANSQRGTIEIDYSFNGGSACGDLTVTGQWSGTTPTIADTLMNLQVGGILVQVRCDAGGCGSATVSAAQLQVISPGATSFAVSGGLDSNSWAACGPKNQLQRYSPTATVANSVACGHTLTFTVQGCAPSPTPVPSATVSPSPSIPPPSPTPAATPLQYPTPPANNPGPPVTNGGTTMSGITNQDIYNDVKQALDDAGTRDSEFGVPNGGFTYGNNPGGENGSAGNGLQDAVDRFTNDLNGTSDGLMGAVDSIDSLDLPTSIGDKSSWNFSLPVLGEITIDLSTFDTPVSAFRILCLAVLLIGAWFAMVKIVRSGIA